MLKSRAEIEAASAAGGGRLPEGEWEVRAVVTVAGFSHAGSVRRHGVPIVLRTSGAARVAARRREALLGRAPVRLASRLRAVA